MHNSHLRVIALLIGGLLLGLPTFAQSPADVTFGVEGLSIQTKVNFDRLILTVGGPNDFVLTQEFDSSSNVFFGIADQALEDGLYTFELKSALASGSDELRAKGLAVSGGETLSTGYFTVANGQIVADVDEAGGVQTKQTFTTDVEIQGSLCVGVDCTTSENFGFDTIRMKENNLRIKFDDTSSSASFPNVDWQLTANDSSNGGANRFSIEDVTNNKNAFTIEANAQANTLYVEADGDVGIKTANPVVDLHIVEGNSPTLRLEQDGSDGFASQTWDLSGNEANFFIRDVNNGSKLPFRIKPGAPDDSIFIAASGNVGIGLDNPGNPLHVKRTDGSTRIFIEDTETTATATRQLLRLESQGQPRFTMVNNGASGGAQTWHIQVAQVDSAIEWVSAGASSTAMELDTSGNLVVAGTLTTAGGVTPDYVFEDDYDLMTLEEVEAFIEEEGHLPKVPSAEEIAVTGLNISDMQNRLLEKVEELTLYTIDQQKMIKEQQSLIAQLQTRLDQVETAQN